MPPMQEALARLWPQAECLNLLDDSLARDLAQAGAITPALVQRMVTLAQYAKGAGAQGVLYTCSAFGPAIEAARRAVALPCYKPNEAMFDAALAACAGSGGGRRRIGLLTTFAPAAAPLLDELHAAIAAIAARGAAIDVVSACAAEAMDALRAADGAAHDRLLLAAARTLPPCDVLLLGQFSMARARTPIEQALQTPTLSSPDSAVRRLQADLRHQPPFNEQE